MNKPKTHTFNGQQHDLDFETRQGYCDSPNGGKPTLYAPLDTGKPKMEMEILIHEMLHASNWYKAEHTVDRTAKDITRLLWRLGYRRKD